MLISLLLLLLLPVHIICVKKVPELGIFVKIRVSSGETCAGVLVLDDRKVVEFDAPNVLRSREGSIFKMLWEQQQQKG